MVALMQPNAKERGQMKMLDGSEIPRAGTKATVTEHTKGPRLWDGKPSAEIRNIKGEMVAMVSLRKPSRPQIDRDAALIAAAPDLLTALRALVGALAVSADENPM